MYYVIETEQLDLFCIFDVSNKVKQGDIVEVDSIVKGRDADDDGTKVMKRGRVVVKEIGPQTRKGKHRLSLIVHKHYKLFRVLLT